MSENSVTQKLSTEGADMLTLAGVNDGNLVELSRLGGVKVALRGDTMSISGPAELVTRATDIARRMIDRARQRMELTPDDVLRLSEDDGSGDGAGGVADRQEQAARGRAVLRRRASRGGQAHGDARLLERLAER